MTKERLVVGRNFFPHVNKAEAIAFVGTLALSAFFIFAAIRLMTRPFRQPKPQ